LTCPSLIRMFSLLLLGLVGCSHPTFPATAEEMAALVVPEPQRAPPIVPQADGDAVSASWEFSVGMSAAEYGDWLMARPSSRFRVSRLDPAHFAVSCSTNGDLYRATLELHDVTAGTRVKVTLRATPY
jgi:hypothetical protein